MMNGRWKAWADSLKNKTYALYLASRDARVPLAAKIIIGLVVAYALSPIDLIPDFIPLIGYLDDLVLLPVGIYFATRLIPERVWQECQALATQKMADLPRSRGAAVVIIAVWLLAVAGFALWLWPFSTAISGT